jgi:hypothetical protein
VTAKKKKKQNKEEGKPKIQREIFIHEVIWSCIIGVFINKS